MRGFWPFLTPSGWFLGLALFQNMFHNLLIYTNNFCFGYIAVSCFFETFPGGWVGGWLGGWLENLILMKTQSSVWTWIWTLYLDLGFVDAQVLCIWYIVVSCFFETFPGCWLGNLVVRKSDFNENPVFQSGHELWTST